MIKLYGICPHCKFETQVEKQNACYCMCDKCGEIFNIMGSAKIQGIALSDQAMEDITKEIESDVAPRVSNFKWRK